MSNIYDTANQLEREIRGMEQFQALSASFSKLKEDASAYAVFKEFQEFQLTMQKKVSDGQEMTDEDAEKAQALTEKIQEQSLIADLMQTEQAFSLVLNDLNRIIMTPLRELYEN